MASNSPKTPPTNAQRTRSFLLYGFGLSILLHLLIGPFVKFDRTQPDEEKVAKVTISRVPTPPPPPKPTPKPTPTPPPTPPPKSTPPPVKHTPEPVRQKIKINTAKTTSHSGQSTEQSNTHTTGSTSGVPNGNSNSPGPSAPPATAPPATAAPATPVPTPAKPACAVPNAPPGMVEAAAPDTPAIAQQQGITGSVKVLVTLDAQSHLVGTPTIQTSPSVVLNAAAIAAAKASRYKTEVKDCVPQQAQYIFQVDFTNE